MELAAKIGTMAANGGDDFVRGKTIDKNGLIVDIATVIVPIVGGHNILYKNSGGPHEYAGCTVFYDSSMRYDEYWNWNNDSRSFTTRSNISYGGFVCDVNNIEIFEVWDITTNTQLVGGGRILVTPSAANGGGV